jgi:hypothetical protein
MPSCHTSHVFVEELDSVQGSSQAVTSDPLRALLEIWCDHELQWVFHETNARPLWTQLRRHIRGSVGTGSKRFTLSYTDATRRGLAQWIAPSFDLLIGSQSFAAHHSAKFLLNDGSYIRVDIDLDQPIALDDYEGSLSLVERGYQAGRIHLDRIARTFC